MHTITKQCSFCRRVAYYTSNNQWSPWLKKLPRLIHCEYYQIAVCEQPECIKAHEDLLQRHCLHESGRTHVHG